MLGALGRGREYSRVEGIQRSSRCPRKARGLIGGGNGGTEGLGDPWLQELREGRWPGRWNSKRELGSDGGPGAEGLLYVRLPSFPFTQSWDRCFYPSSQHRVKDPGGEGSNDQPAGPLPSPSEAPAPPATPAGGESALDFRKVKCLWLLFWRRADRPVLIP